MEFNFTWYEWFGLFILAFVVWDLVGTEKQTTLKKEREQRRLRKIINSELIIRKIFELSDIPLARERLEKRGKLTSFLVALEGVITPSLENFHRHLETTNLDITKHSSNKLASIFIGNEFGSSLISIADKLLQSVFYKGCYVGPAGEQDPKYHQAIEIVIDSRKASVSNLQRRLGIDYNRAVKIIEDMEKAKLVTPLQDNGNREILNKLSNL
jgi:DNA segregation ATPase FtsK/SpoIIIE-like protein